MKLTTAAALALLTACATSQEAAFDARADSARAAAWHPPLPPMPKKMKGNSSLTIIYQYAAPGGSNSATPTAVSRTSGPVGAGPNAAASEATRNQDGTPWLLLGVVLVAGAVGWPFLKQKWAAWRARPS